MSPPANGGHADKSSVGAASSASMSLLWSFGFWRFAIYRDAAPLGLSFGDPSVTDRRYRASKVSVGDGGDDWGGFPGALPVANFRGPCGTFWGVWLDRVVEREGFIKCITVIHLTRGCVIAGCDLLDVSWQRRAPRAAIAESGKTFTEANEGNQ